MSLSPKVPKVPAIRLWCIAASDAPIVAVIAKCYSDKSWTCILRWNWDTESKAQLEEGAWTTLAIRAPWCALSPDGTYFYYHASGPEYALESPHLPKTKFWYYHESEPKRIYGPFSGSSGGAHTISRLPWISALTGIHAFAGGPVESVSRDGLSEQSQLKLWSIFEPWEKKYRTQNPWPSQLGPIWTAIPRSDIPKDPKLASLALDHPPHHAAYARIHGTNLNLLAIVNNYGKNGRPAPWSVWLGHVKYFITQAADSARVNLGSFMPPYELKDVSWAYPVQGARLLVATTDVKLRVLRFSLDQSVPTFTQPIVGAQEKPAKSKDMPREEQSHDLSGLKPNPGPAPDWAKAELDQPKLYRS